VIKRILVTLEVPEDGHAEPADVVRRMLTSNEYFSVLQGVVEELPQAQQSSQHDLSSCPISIRAPLDARVSIRAVGNEIRVEVSK